MAYQHAYVFAATPNRGLALCGEVRIEGELGSFTYVQSWLEAGWAYPLDPVNLPLSIKPKRTNNSHKVFGVLRDAGPDDWGTKIMLMHHQRTPQNELERLLRTSGGGVGSIQFSLSRRSVKAQSPLPDIS